MTADGAEDEDVEDEANEAEQQDVADGSDSVGNPPSGIIDSLLHDFTNSTLMAHQQDSSQGSSCAPPPDEEDLHAGNTTPVSSLDPSDVEETLWKTLTFQKVYIYSCSSFCNFFFRF